MSAIDRLKVQSLQAEIERLQTMLAEREWRPIATAPKDDSRILVWIPDENDGHHFAHAGVDYWRLESWYLSRPGRSPTHWIPLPAPPCAALADEGER